MDVTHVHESDVQESEEVRGCHDLERKKACIFCDKSSHRRVRMRNEPLSISKKWKNWENYLVDAVNSENFEKVVTIRSYLDNKIPIPYHKTCRNDYRSVLAKKVCISTSDWHKTRDCYREAYEVVKKFVVKFVIKKKNACTLDFLNRLFKEALLDEYNKLKNSGLSEGVTQFVYTKHLGSRIQNTFKRKIKIDSFNKTKLILPYSGIKINIDTLTDNDILQKSALILRRAIIDNKTTKFGSQITAEDLMDGECDIPEELDFFFTTVLAGFNYRRRKSPRTVRLVKSFSSDLIHAVSNGKMLPSKHIVLGSTIKSFSNSKKIVRILHRYGHICSYNVLEELETEVTYSSVD